MGRRRTAVRYGAADKFGRKTLLKLSLTLATTLTGFSPLRTNVSQIAFGQQPQPIPQADAQTSDAAATIALAGLEQQFAAVAKKVSPSVVAISATGAKNIGDASLRSEEMNGGKLEAILDRGVRTVGTGFVVDEDGYVVTNEHVVMDAEQVWVTTDSGKVYPAIVVGTDPRADLAVLKVPTRSLPAVKFARSETLRRGMWSIALGNPYGLATTGEMAMAVGVVSALDRSLPKLATKENRIYSGLIQTTAEINPGNSGGPLIDIHGNVIGINSAVILPQKQTNGIGFAMPISERVTQLLRDLKDGREVTYGFLGVTASTPTAKERRSAGAAADVGARIEVIDPNSPAQRGGLQVEDLVLSINGTLVRDSDQFVRLIGETPTDRASKVIVARGGKTVVLDVTPGRRAVPSTPVTRDNRRLRWKGMLLGPVPANWSADRGKDAEPGVVVLAIDKDSPAAREGVKQGSVITTVAGKRVTSVEDVQQVINDTPLDECVVQCTGPAEAIASSTAAPASGQ